MVIAEGLSANRFIAWAREVDSQLHDLIAESCGNNFLSKEIGWLKLLFRAFRDMVWEHDAACNDYHRLTEEAQEHLAIVEALIAGDRRTAALAMARHIRSGGRYWTRACAKPHAPQRHKEHKERKGTIMNRTPAIISSLCVLCVFVVVSSIQAAGPEYNRDVRPILAENCFPCHGPDSAARKAELRLDRSRGCHESRGHRSRQAG